MKIFITGGTGFLGSAITEKLLAEGHEVTVLSRSPRKSSLRTGLSFCVGNPTVSGSWQQEISKYDVVINLAGASIFKPWTAKNKEEIYNSRILSTRNIVEAITAGSGKTTLLLNGSAVGYYGFRDDAEIDENSSPGDDFLATVVRDWEAEALKAEAGGVRVVLCRFGIILGSDGGALSKMLPIFKWGLGSPLGDGKQWFSWIALPDLLNIFLFLLDNEAITGPLNCTSPKPVTNRQLTKALGKALHRPTILPPVPAFLLKGLLGEFGDVFAKGQKVLPERLLAENFIFEFPEIADALTHLLK